MELAPEQEFSLSDLVTILRRRRIVIAATLVATMMAAGLYCTLATRRYEATATLQLQKESSDAMGLNSLMNSAGGASDALDANIDLQTQANILQSETLALGTIQSLHLEDTADFRIHRTFMGWLSGFFTAKEDPDSRGVSLESSPRRRQRLVTIFQKNLDVKPIGGTRLLQISYLNPDPRLAAAIVNSLTRGLSDYTFQTRYNATTQASQWLSGQMGDLRRQSEELQGRVLALQHQSEVYSLGTTDGQGREQAYSGVLDQLQQSTAALTQARQNRILKGAIAHAADSSDAETLSGLAGNGMAANSQTLNNALTVIQNLRQQEASQQAALQEAEAKYGSSYPRLAELQGSLAGLEHSIHQEMERIRARADSDYAIAVQSEAGAKSQYNEVKEQAN